MIDNIKNYYSIAPMMGKTDNFFCFLMQLINKNVSVYTEMMHSETIIRTNVLNNYKILKDYSNITVQIAGNNPYSMTNAAKKISSHGFKKININCGCPSKNVVAGEFGLHLLRKPTIVKECIKAIKNNIDIDISVKTRVGIGYEDNADVLDKFIYEVGKSGINKYIIHARNGILGKLSTKKNLSIPPLKYERVFDLKKKFSKNIIIINGGFLNTLDYKKYSNKIDGIMIGREAYKNPWIFAKKNITLNEKINLVSQYLNDLKIYFKSNQFNKKSLYHIQNIFNNYFGAKKWRNIVNFALNKNDLHPLINYIKSDKLGKKFEK